MAPRAAGVVGRAGAAGVVGRATGRGATAGVGVRAATRGARGPGGAVTTATTVPASVSTVCGAETADGSPKSPTGPRGVTGGVGGWAVERHAATAPTAMPSSPIARPAAAICRRDGPVTIDAAMSWVDIPERVPCPDPVRRAGSTAPVMVPPGDPASPCTVGGATRAPHSLQNFASSGLGAPQDGQNTPRP